MAGEMSPEHVVWKVAFEPVAQNLSVADKWQNCKLIMRRKFSYIARSSQK